MLENFDPTTITDEELRSIVVLLMTEVERLSAEVSALKEDNQRLWDENRRLKGEQGTPVVRPQSLSSEAERHASRPHHKGHKQRHVSIDREEIRRVDPARLPPDAQFKGYVDVVVQEICFHTENVLFRKEKFYSPSAQRTYLADLPQGYRGQFGPGVRSWVLSLAYASGVSQPKIKDLLATVGIQISAGELSALLIKEHAIFHQERQDIVRAGVASTLYQHLDSTATRVYGQNHACHVLCNPYYTAYSTQPTKDRISLVAALLGGQEPAYRVSAHALQIMQQWKIPQTWIDQVVARLPWEEVLSAETLRGLLQGSGLPWYRDKEVRAALAISYYRTQTDMPVVPLLVVDDAAQFNALTDELALCWIHEWRHYKKLEPRLAYHRQCLATFGTDFWAFYRRLLAYREQPSRAEATALRAAFDALFSPPTGYAQLDHRVALTRAKKEQLLKVLQYPAIPLHNNPAELGARQRVRKRDLSLAARTQEGVAAWDTFQTIVETAKKLGVNATAYLRDRLSGRYRLPSLASLITERSAAAAPACAA
jgi:Transposase IS66 family